MKATIEIKGMHCASCEILIKEGVEELQGIKKISVSRKTNSAEVEFDESKTNLKEIKSKIKEEGYEAL